MHHVTYQLTFRVKSVYLLHYCLCIYDLASSCGGVVQWVSWTVRFHQRQHVWLFSTFLLQVVTMENSRRLGFCVNFRWKLPFHALLYVTQSRRQYIAQNHLSHPLPASCLNQECMSLSDVFVLSQVSVNQVHWSNFYS